MLIMRRMCVDNEEGAVENHGAPIWILYSAETLSALHYRLYRTTPLVGVVGPCPSDPKKIHCNRGAVGGFFLLRHT